MLLVVGTVIARLCVREDSQPSAVQCKELGDLAEDVPWYGQLNTPSRMGSDRPQVKMTNGD